MKPKHTALLFFIVSILVLSFIFSDEVIKKSNDVATFDKAPPSNDEKEIQSQRDNFINPTLVKLPALECINYLQNYEVTQAWQKENKTRLKELFISLIDNGLTGEEFDHVAFLTKVAPSNAKALIGLYNLTNKALPMIAGDQGVFLPKEYTQRVYNDLLDHKMSGIIHLVEQGIITGNTYMISDSGQYSLIGSILMSGISLEQKTDVINKLINLDIKITYQDLMVSTQLNMPLALIQKLMLASQLNVSFVLPVGAENKSLAQIALENKNVLLLDYWLEQGSPSVINPFKSTLLDLLPPAINEADKTVQSELFITLMRHGITANNHKTQYKLKAWLDDEYIRQYKTSIEQATPMSMNIGNKSQIGAAVSDVFFTVLQPLIKSQDLLNVRNPCFQSEGLRIINNIFRSKKLFPPTLSNNNLATTDQALYSQEELLTMDAHDARVILGKNKSLAAKHTIVKLSDRRRMNSIKLASALEYTKEEHENKQKYINLMDLAENGQWKKVIMELSANEYPAEVINFIMIYAVKQQKDIEFLLQLHSFSGSFSMGFMHAVVERNDINLARKLVSHGLDFRQSNNLGSNAIYTAVLHKKMAMLRYLIDEGIKVKPYEYGLDPLDLALRNLKQNPASFNFITVLIDAGAPIELSHQEKTFEFSIINIELYLKLISTFPMLKKS